MHIDEFDYLLPQELIAQHPAPERGASRLLHADAATGSLDDRRFADPFITPCYRFRAVDRLLTNFHLPRSTLLMLVAAFGGLDFMRRAYAHAIAQRYRFFSYGDAMLIERLD